MLILFFLLLLPGPRPPHQSVFPYQLQQPLLSHRLPAVLNEVSGLTDVDSVHIACVQDEEGTVYIYNFRSGHIVARHPLDGPGDFEGLTRTGNTLYMLRSDGRLTEWPRFTSGKTNIKHYQLPLLTANNEGLCYDEAHHRLLIAAKSKPDDERQANLRYIYAVDLKTKRLLPKPVYELDVRVLEQAAARSGIGPRAFTPRGKPRPFNFRPSSLAVHPASGHLYIISAADQLLLVMNRQGHILHLEPLPANPFTKPEGITFLPDGTMIITNEAADKVPTLMVYKMK